MFYSWLHLIALVVYLGAVIGFWLMLLPAVAVLENHDEKVRFFVRGLKFYNPLQVGSLGIILFTGAFQLTELKAAYRENFFKYLEYNLFIKVDLRLPAGHVQRLPGAWYRPSFRPANRRRRRGQSRATKLNHQPHDQRQLGYPVIRRHHTLAWASASPVSRRWQNSSD